MKNSIYIGGFCPLHRGHMDVIMRAKKENEKLHLVVYGYDNEPRAKQIGADTLQRYMRISDFFKNDEQIEVSMAHFKENQTDWEFLISHIMKTRNCEKKNTIIYTGEPAYHSFLVIHGYNCVYVNSSCGIGLSGKSIRNNPYKFKEFITSPFKDLFHKPILLTGASCEGKSTCGLDLAKYFGCPYVPECSKEYAKLHHLKLELCKSEDIESFIKVQFFTNNVMTSEELSIHDGDTVSNLSYAKLLLSNEEYNALKDKCLEKYKIDFAKIFVFSPHNNFVNDGVRTMAAPFEVRKAVFDTICNLYSEENIEFEILNGSYSENFETIKQYILK